MSNLSGKNILITGEHGFIGKKLVERLQKIPDVNLYCLNKRDLLGPTCPWEACSWADVVIHLGAFTPKCKADANNIDLIYESNIAATYNLLASLYKVPYRIVFASTLDVYKLTNEVITESSEIGPESLYGHSKLFCEGLINSWCTENNSTDCILRYGNIYGPGEEAYKKLIPETIRSIMTDNIPIIYGDGSSLRDFIYIDDVVEATIRAADTAPLGVTNIVSGKSRPVKEWVETISNLMYSRLDIEYQPKYQFQDNRVFDNSLMTSEFGHWDQVPIEVGLQKEIDYFKSL